MAGQPVSAGVLAEDAKLFGQRSDILSMDLSPSGTKIVSLIAGKGSQSFVVVTDLATKAMKRILGSKGTPEAISSCAFASETQLVCNYGANIQVGEDLLGFHRLLTVDTTTLKVQKLGQRDVGSGLRQDDGEILDWLPDENGTILMSRTNIPDTGGLGWSGNGRGLGVDRIDLATLKASQVELPRQGTSAYLTDGRGHVRMMRVDESDSSFVLTGIVAFKYRLAGSHDWKLFGRYDRASGTGLYPVGIDAASDSAYVLEKAEGRDALYKVKLDGTMAKTLVGQDGKVDIDGIVRIGHGQRIAGYTFANERRRTIFFDPTYAKLETALSKVLGDNSMVDFVSASRDDQKLLIYVTGARDPGTFYLYNQANHHLDPIGLNRPQLDETTLADVTPVAVKASDGAEIPAYLTLPPHGTGKNLPAVILPHGGPSARDEWGFDWLAQFLTARGYAVIQPNYRGSAGYGDAWMAKNGFQGWRTSIGDVTASARWLVVNGIADPKRLAIMGWSYGGYAALQSAAIEPGLYKAVIAVAPVTDLGMLKRESDGFTNSRLVHDFVGKGAHITEGSPLRNAAAIKAPVLLVHGDLDTNVSIEHSRRMAAALRSAGANVEFLPIKGLDHQLEDSEVRTLMLTKVGDLLERTIGH